MHHESAPVRTGRPGYPEFPRSRPPRWAYLYEMAVERGMAQERQLVRAGPRFHASRRSTDMTIARILLVEDDPVSRELIAALLASRGHEVDAVDDGFGALRLAQEKSYDLVFVDYHLPEMDGYALARLMRSLNDTSSGALKMVAITADRFGLAARRGVDSIFDRVLTKPIEPETLFAFVDEFLGEESALDELEAFLATPPATEDPRMAGQMLWRVRGLGALPAAAVFPRPTSAERVSLEHCFRLVDDETADCLILLRPAGLAAIEALRAKGRPCLQPLFVLDPKLADLADVRFNVGDGDSWSAVADTLTRFAARAKSLNAGIAASNDFETRLAAYIYVSDRPLALCRDAAGQTTVPYTAGFSVAASIEAIKRLAARGLVSAKLDATATADERRLVVGLTPKGMAFVAADGPERARSAS